MSLYSDTSGVGHLTMADIPTLEGGRGGVIGDDYPWKDLGPDSMFDPWGEYVRECTSFVAWRLHEVNGFDMPFYDNASGWGPKARDRGFTVDGAPAPGAVAWWASGHVAWVAEVNGSNVTIEEYNHVPFAYSTRVIQAGEAQYIHFSDLAPPSPEVTSPTPTELQGSAPVLQGGSQPNLQGSSPNLQGGQGGGSTPPATASPETSPPQTSPPPATSPPQTSPQPTRPPPPTMVPPPAPHVVVSWDSIYYGNARYIVTSISDFPANATLTLQCHDEEGFTFPAFTVSTFSGSHTFQKSNGEAVCRQTPGLQTWVTATVNGATYNSNSVSF
jgi:surface antigen